MADPVFVDEVTPLDAANMNKLQTRDEKAVANGYPSLDGTGKVPLAQLPPIAPAGADLSYDGDWVAGTYQDGDVVVKDGIAYLCVGGPTAVAPDPTLWGAAALAKTAYGTSLPASPADGQEAILVDNVANPSYQWRFRWNAGSSSAYKWEFIGGIPARSLVGLAAEGTAGVTFNDLTTIGPAVTTPRAGDYLCEYGAQIWNAGGSMAIRVGATPAASADAVGSSVGAGTTTPARVRTFTGVAAATQLKAEYAGSAGTAFFLNRWLNVTPVRVA